MKLLIVDDDEIARISLSNILQSSGLEIVQACDGEAAWELLDGGLRPILCCSDILMPRLDGLRLMRRARQHPVLADLPFVLISTAADRATVQDAIAGGVAGYIIKPFLAVQTRTTVERVIRERRASQAEDVEATRKRLNTSGEELGRMLNVFASDATQLAGEVEHGGADTRRRDHVQRLRGASLLLGLWRAASFLERGARADAGAADPCLALREAAILARDQIEELGAQVPVEA